MYCFRHDIHIFQKLIGLIYRSKLINITLLYKYIRNLSSNGSCTNYSILRFGREVIIRTTLFVF